MRRCRRQIRMFPKISAMWPNAWIKGTMLVVTNTRVNEFAKAIGYFNNNRYNGKTSIMVSDELKVYQCHECATGLLNGFIPFCGPHFMLALWFIINWVLNILCGREELLSLAFRQCLAGYCATENVFLLNRMFK